MDRINIIERRRCVCENKNKAKENKKKREIN